MPVYDLECNSCKHVWESWQKMDDPLPACPTCGSSEVRKLPAAPGLSFKGSGWAKDGYAKQQPKGSA